MLRVVLPDHALEISYFSSMCSNLVLGETCVQLHGHKAVQLCTSPMFVYSYSMSDGTSFSNILNLKLVINILCTVQYRYNVQHSSIFHWTSNKLVLITTTV